MKKTTKEILFERMNTIGGMPLNEHEVAPETIEKAASEYPERDESPSYQVKLDNINRCSQELHDLIEDFDQLPTWVQDKITIAEHNMKAIHDWIRTLGHEEDEHGQLVDEGQISESEVIDESKNKPNDSALWSRAKAAAKKKFDVYPSAYANAFASKWYKDKGGTWSKKKKND